MKEIKQFLKEHGTAIIKEWENDISITFRYKGLQYFILLRVDGDYMFTVQPTKKNMPQLVEYFSNSDDVIKRLKTEFEQRGEEEELDKPITVSEITINGKLAVLNGKIDKDLQKQLWRLEDKLSKALKELKEINAALYNPKWKVASADNSGTTEAADD